MTGWAKFSPPECTIPPNRRHFPASVCPWEQTWSEFWLSAHEKKRCGAQSQPLLRHLGKQGLRQDTTVSYFMAVQSFSGVHEELTGFLVN